MVKRVLEIPEALRGKKIFDCYEIEGTENMCPFWDDGDSGYAAHCNLLEHFMNKKIENGAWAFDDCPLEEATE